MHLYVITANCLPYASCRNDENSAFDDASDDSAEPHERTRPYGAGAPRGVAAAATGATRRARSAPAASGRQQSPRLAARLSGTAAHALGIDAARRQARLGQRGAHRSEYRPTEASGADLHRRPGVVEPDIALTLDGSAAGVTFRTGVAQRLPQRGSRSVVQGWAAAAAAVAAVVVLRPSGDTARHAWHAQCRERRSGRISRTGSSTC